MQIGWIGTGVMGAPMAQHLMNAGHELFIYNRTEDKAASLISNGAHLLSSPAEIVANCEILFTMIGYPSDVEEVYFEQEGGILANGNKTARILIDMTTSPPDLARRINRISRKYKLHFLDAPVSGGDIGAREAKLAIMVGGTENIFKECLPLFELLGKNIAYMGPSGSGQHTKLCNQILVAGNIIGVCESLLYAQASGLDAEAVIDIIGKGAAGSWAINNLGPRIISGDFAPGFYVDHFIKDMRIVLDTCDHLHLSLPGLGLVYQLFQACRAQGHGHLGTQALMLALQHLNGSGYRRQPYQN